MNDVKPHGTLMKRDTHTFLQNIIFIKIFYKWNFWPSIENHLCVEKDGQIEDQRTKYDRPDELHQVSPTRYDFQIDAVGMRPTNGELPFVRERHDHQDRSADRNSRTDFRHRGNGLQKI